MQSLFLTSRSPSIYNTDRHVGSAGRPALAAASFLMAVLLLLAMLPTLAAAPSGVPANGPIPMPAPPPAVVTSVNFPEQARPWRGCTAVLERSSAIDNARSDRANTITSALIQDACFGA